MINKISLQLLTCNFHFLFLKIQHHSGFCLIVFGQLLTFLFFLILSKGDFKLFISIILKFHSNVIWCVVCFHCYARHLALNLIFLLLFILCFSLPHLSVFSYEILTHLDSLSNFFFVLHFPSLLLIVHFGFVVSVILFSGNLL